MILFINANLKYKNGTLYVPKTDANINELLNDVEFYRLMQY